MTINLENYYGKAGDATSGWINQPTARSSNTAACPNRWPSSTPPASAGSCCLAPGMIFFGITNRLALVFGAAVMLSLSFGLFTLDDSQEIGYIASQFALFVAAIALAKHNRLMVFGKF